MVHRGQDAGFALEADEPLAITSHFRQQHLQRDVAIEFRISGAIHLSHAAGAKRRHDLVVTNLAAGCECHGEKNLTSGSYWRKERSPIPLHARIEVLRVVQIGSEGP